MRARVHGQVSETDTGTADSLMRRDPTVSLKRFWHLHSAHFCKLGQQTATDAVRVYLGSVGSLWTWGCSGTVLPSIPIQLVPCHPWADVEASSLKSSSHLPEEMGQLQKREGC